MTVTAPQILIRDDGELGEIRSLLEQIGVEYVDQHKESSSELPSHLLITSGQRAIDSIKEANRGGRRHHFLHLVVIDQASRSLHAMLERHGCDMVARRPVHPTVLRLLVQRALYQGEEKRNLARVAIGEPVKFKSGLLARSATLAELSLRGCGLITRQAIEVGCDLKITLPAQLVSGGAMTIDGRVVGTQRDLRVEDGHHSVAVIFTSCTRADRRKLQDIMDSHAVGSTGHLEQAPGTPFVQSDPHMVVSAVAPPTSATQTATQTAAASTEAPAADTDASDRRDTPRHAYEQSVLARAADATHSLIGRDLSLGGMRVEAESGLGLGAQLQLAIYGNAGVPPVMVKAEVVRDDASEGLGLKFDPLSGPARARLQTIVEALADLDEASSTSGTVVSEVLEVS
jgi:hypothetical protein